MCLKCEKSTSHVGKRLKSEQHMWATCEHMWLTCGPMFIQCDFSVGEGPGGHYPPPSFGEWGEGIRTDNVKGGEGPA